MNSIIQACYFPFESAVLSASFDLDSALSSVWLSEESFFPVASSHGHANQPPPPLHQPGLSSQIHPNTVAITSSKSPHLSHPPPLMAPISCALSTYTGIITQTWPSCPCPYDTTTLLRFCLPSLQVSNLSRLCATPNCFCSSFSSFPSYIYVSAGATGLRTGAL